MKINNLRNIIKELISEGDLVDLSKHRIMPSTNVNIEREDELSQLIEEFYEKINQINIPQYHKFEDLATTIKVAMDDYFMPDDNELDDNISDSERLRFLDYMKSEDDLD